MKKDYHRSLTLLCPTCASEELSAEGHLPEELSEFLCGSCGMKHRYQDIVAANSERASALADEIKKEIVVDLSRDVRNIFKGLKGWRLR